jgi:hypothetical protein
MSIPFPVRRFSSFTFITTVAAGFCVINSINVHAAEYDYLIEATALAEQIENPRRAPSSSPTSDEEEFLFQQRLRLNLNRATSKLVTNIDYQGTKNNYQDNLLSDRTYITGASSVEWIISPERLSWDLSNTRSLQVLDTLLPDTIDNRQVISLTSTGPRATFQISGRNKLSGSLNYSIADYERSSLAAQNRAVADLLFSHNFSTSFISSIGGNYLQSRIDDAPVLDFDRYEYFWQNQYVTEVFDVNLMLGQNVLVRDNFEDQENFLVRLTGNYKVNSQSSFGFNYSDSYEDVFSNMLSSPVNPDQLIGDRFGNSNLNQNYELVRAGIDYLYTRSEFFNMNLGYSHSKRTYDIPSLIVINDIDGDGIGDIEDLNGDGFIDFNDVSLIVRNQTDDAFNIGANWKFFQNLDLSLYGRYTEQEFGALNREQERSEYGMRLGYRISQSLYTRFNIFSVDQTGTLPQDEYDGLNYSLSLTFVLGN